MSTNLNLVQKRFGVKLRMLRLERKLTQEALADKAGLHWTYVSGIERGIRNISLKNIVRLSNALRVKSKTLLDFEKGY